MLPARCGTIDDQPDDQHREHGRCIELADGQAASRDRLVEKIADGGAVAVGSG